MPLTYGDIDPMDDKLRNVLELALDPRTGEGESAAALAAARRLVAKQGIELLAAPAQERVVYRDKVVYRNKAHNHSLILKMTIPAKYHHSMITHIFVDAQTLNCDVELIACDTKGPEILSGTIIEFKVSGTESAVKQYNSIMTAYVSKMRSMEGVSMAQDTSPPKKSPPKTPKKGWLSKIFG